MGLNIWALSIVKAVGADYPAVQLVFLRAAVGLAVILPWVWAERAAFARIDRWGLHLLRVGLSAVTLAASFYAIARVPFALFTALNFTRPILLMVMAAAILGERIGTRRWVAAGVGLAGALIAIGPAAGGDVAGLAAMLVMVVTGTAAVIVTRALRGTPAVVMMAFYTAGLGLASLPGTVVAWTPVAPGHWSVLLLVGVFAQVAQLTFLRAHALGDAGVLGPASYLHLPLSAAVGWWLFAEVPGPGMLAGAALIVGAGLVLARDTGRPG
jgi:drug/metabolite transporter (DMT)-like permease